MFGERDSSRDLGGDRNAADAPTRSATTSRPRHLVVAIGKAMRGERLVDRGSDYAVGAQLTTSAGPHSRTTEVWDTRACGEQVIGAPCRL